MANKKKADEHWKCPQCGVNAHVHPKGMKSPKACLVRDGRQCEGLICECSEPGSNDYDHGTADNPCVEANCYHCGWGGAIPTMPSEPHKVSEPSDLNLYHENQMLRAQVAEQTVGDVRDTPPGKDVHCKLCGAWTPKMGLFCAGCGAALHGGKVVFKPLCHWSLACELKDGGVIGASEVVLTLEPFCVSIPLTDDQRETIEAMRKAVYG